MTLDRSQRNFIAEIKEKIRLANTKRSRRLSVV
jgi:hypothetical protein